MAPWANGPASPYWGPVSYGAGWQYFGLAPQPLITHDGTETNFKCSILLVPGANIGIVILSNIGANFTSNASLGDRPAVVQKIAFRFYDLYFGRYTSEAELDEHVSRVQALQAGPASAPASVTSESPDLPLKSYCGGLLQSSLWRIHSEQVKRQTGDNDGAAKMHARMVPVGGNTFWAYLPDYPDNFPMYLPLTFAFPSSGPATMTIGTVLGWPQNDVFTRISD